MYMFAEILLPKFKCRNLPAMAAMMLGSACATGMPDGVELVCTVNKRVQENRDCSSVPSLSEGVLSLSADGRFTLNGRYDACYQIEEVQLSGTYVSDPFESGMDLELLATHNQTDNQRTQTPARTIGLVNLDTQSLEARFTDTSAVIRSRGQLSTVAPSVEMDCIRR